MKMEEVRTLSDGRYITFDGQVMDLWDEDGTFLLNLGQLPYVVGFEPIYAFPSALLLMTFLSFFIGIFLQLMWEELPITEPL